MVLKLLFLLMFSYQCYGHGEILGHVGGLLKGARHELHTNLHKVGSLLGGFTHRHQQAGQNPGPPPHGHYQNNGGHGLETPDKVVVVIIDENHGHPSGPGNHQPHKHPGGEHFNYNHNYESSYHHEYNHQHHNRPDQGIDRPSYPNYGNKPNFGNYGSKPGYGNNQPDYGNNGPNYGNNGPNYGNNQPDYGNNGSNNGNNQPNFESNQPSYGNRPGYGGRPSYGNNQPNYGHNNPTGGNNQPGYGNNKPDYGLNQPDYGNNNGNNNPDYGQNHQDSGNNQPNFDPNLNQNNVFTKPTVTQGPILDNTTEQNRPDKTTKKLESDSPLFVPLDPNPADYGLPDGKDKEPKRETKPAEDADEDFNIDIRFKETK